MGCFESSDTTTSTIVLLKLGKDELPKKLLDGFEALRDIDGVINLSHG